MGGGLLRTKSYNPHSRENRARVARDEAEAAARERQAEVSARRDATREALFSGRPAVGGGDASTRGVGSKERPTPHGPLEGRNEGSPARGELPFRDAGRERPWYVRPAGGAHVQEKDHLGSQRQTASLPKRIRMERELAEADAIARKRRADGSTVLSCGVALLRGHEGDNTPSNSAKRPKTIEALRAERLAREQHESRRINEVLQRARGSGARPSRQPHPGFG